MGEEHFSQKGHRRPIDYFTKGNGLASQMFIAFRGRGILHINQLLTFTTLIASSSRCEEEKEKPSRINAVL